MPSPTNPLYIYLQQNPVDNIEFRRDRFNAEYLIINLPEIEAHISVYAELKADKNDQKPIFHFTLLRKNRNIHIYFDENHKEINASEEDLTSHTFKALKDNLPEEEQLIYELYETHALPVIQNILLAHKHAISQGQEEFRRSLERYNHTVFSSNTPEVLLGLVNTAERQGVSLLEISYNKNFITKILSFLQKAQQLINDGNQAGFAANSKAIEKVDLASELSEVQTQPVKKNKKKKKKKTQAQSASLDNLSNEQKRTSQESFEHFYSVFKQHLNAFEVIPQQNIEEKIIAFNALHRDLADLFLSSSEILKYEQQFADQPALLHKAKLELSIWQEDYFNNGVKLLEEMLKNPQYLEIYGNSFKRYANFISPSFLEDTLRNGYTQSFKYLLENNQRVSIDNYLVTTEDPRQPRATLIVQAFMREDLQAFTVLLTKGASCMCLYHDLPLAHAIFKLPLNNPFRVEFSRYYKPALSGSAAFYCKLESALERYLKNNSLSAAEFTEIIEYQSKYAESKKVSHEHLSDSLRDGMATVLSHTHSNLDERIKDSPKLRDANLELKKLNDGLSNLLKKRHLLDKQKLAADKMIRESNSLIAKYGKEMSKSITTEGMEQDIEKAKLYLQSMITYLKLKDKNKLSKKENKALKDSLVRIQEYDSLGQQRTRSAPTGSADGMQDFANLLKFFGTGFTQNQAEQTRFNQMIDETMNTAQTAARRGDRPSTNPLSTTNLFAPPTQQEEQEIREFLQRMGSGA